MSNNNDDFSDFDEIAGSDIAEEEYSFDDFCDLALDNIQDLKEDALTTHCQVFILEHNLPDDTEPSSIRQRVWRAIGFRERLRLMFSGIRP